MTMTFSLTELWKVEVFPALRISKSVVIKYSSRSFSLELVSVLPHNVWWELASHPNIWPFQSIKRHFWMKLERNVLFGTKMMKMPNITSKYISCTFLFKLYFLQSDFMQNCLFCLLREINFLNFLLQLTSSSICYFISRISALISDIHLHFDKRMSFLWIIMCAWKFLEFPAWSSLHLGESMLWRIDIRSKVHPTVGVREDLT